MSGQLALARLGIRGVQVVYRVGSDHWLQNIERAVSPHCDDRPQKDDISLLVVHNISLPPNDFGGGYVKQFFTGALPVDEHEYFTQIAALRVSAHCFIERSGHVVQFVPFHRRAWHAGVSEFKGRSACNDFSIGIELEGSDDLPYDERQYASLLDISVALIDRYPKLTLDTIVGHCDIAPGRKTDPGAAFDWAMFRARASRVLQV